MKGLLTTQPLHGKSCGLLSPFDHEFANISSMRVEHRNEGMAAATTGRALNQSHGCQVKFVNPQTADDPSKRLLPALKPHHRSPHSQSRYDKWPCAMTPAHPINRVDRIKPFAQFPRRHRPSHPTFTCLQHATSRTYGRFVPCRELGTDCLILNPPDSSMTLSGSFVKPTTRYAEEDFRQCRRGITRLGGSTNGGDLGC